VHFSTITLIEYAFNQGLKLVEPHDPDTTNSVAGVSLSSTDEVSDVLMRTLDLNRYGACGGCEHYVCSPSILPSATRKLVNTLKTKTLD